MSRTICILFAVSLTLSACATAMPPTLSVTTVCLAMANYTAAQQKAAGAALAALPADSPLVTFMADYGALRAADRACMTAGH